MRVHSVNRHEGEPPNDKVHRIAQAMLNAWEHHPESAGVHVIAFVTESVSGQSVATTALGGYEDDSDAFVDMIAHAMAVAQANGMRLEMFPIQRGEG